MSVIGSNILAGASGQAGYFLTKSLRFRSSASAYLNRTPASAGNRQKWTWSGWVKRGALSSGSYMDLFTALSGANDFTEVRYHFNANDDTIVFTDIASGTTYAVYSTNIYRDPSAWYHIVCSVDTTQATNTNRVKLYVNGVQVTQNAGGSGYPLQNTNTSVNATVEHRHGSVATYGRYFDGYLAEVNFIDGQALTPSSFGETSTTTGVWIPKKYTGSYGTNGFYLPFTDTASTSTLGTDFSGNSNTWTVNNISLTAGSTYDSMTDVPTLTSATTANYAVFNPLAKGSAVTISDGNLKYSSNSASGTNGIVSMYITTGMKSYFEFTCGSAALYRNIAIGGMTYTGDGGAISGGTGGTGTFATWTTGDVIRFACDFTVGTIACYKNATLQTTVTGVTNTSPWEINAAQAVGLGEYTANFGQQPFAYTPPTGFVALNTFNLPTPTIGATASSQAGKYFNPVLYTGTDGVAGSVTGVGFQPDFVWGKRRSVNASHTLYDAVRGATKEIYSDLTNAEGTNSNGLTAFNSDGFSYGVSSALSQGSIVAWCWKANGAGSTNTAGSITSTVSANTTAGFSVVTYSGNNTDGATIGHGLGVNPSMIIVKRRSNASQWIVMHTKLTAANNIFLSVTNAQDAITNISGGGISTATTSTTFTAKIGSSNIDNVNGTSNTYVAYCFTQVAGYSAFGSYTGNGSTDGTFVYTGFRPRWILIKVSSGGTGSWILYDTARNTYNVSQSILYPNLSDAEATTSSANLDILSNGFKLRTSNADFNGSTFTYIYACFAENPFKYANAR